MSWQHDLKKCWKQKSVFCEDGFINYMYLLKSLIIND